MVLTVFVYTVLFDDLYTMYTKHEECSIDYRVSNKKLFTFTYFESTETLNLAYIHYILILQLSFNAVVV